MAKDLLDLHGYKVEDVAITLDRFLREAADRGLNRVRIMTGKGSGKVKAEVSLYLRRAQYPWSFEKLANGRENEGVLVVFLD